MKNQILLNIYIGPCFQYSSSQSKYGCIFDNNSIKFPGTVAQEALFLEKIIVYVIDVHDFYKKYLADKIESFRIRIFLNNKTQHKMFNYNEAIEALDKINQSKSEGTLRFSDL